MRKHATTLIAPLAALAVVGTIGAGPANATGDGHGDEYGHHDHGPVSVQVETSDEAEATFTEAGATLAAVEPATAEEAEDGTVELTFPTSEEQDLSSGQAAFDGGLTVSGAAGDTSWLDPALDTSDWQVSFDVDGQRVDVLEVVPEEGEAFAAGESHEGNEGHEADLALTAEGADALNAVVGGGAFAAGDVLGDAGPAAPEHESGHDWDESDSDDAWSEGHPSHDWGR